MNISSALASLLSVPSDNMIYVVIMFIIGLVLIVKGGDIFVDAATWIAEATGIPKFIIGATVVSFATTLPEMIVSAIAAAKGQNDMAVGNAVGSVTANIGLIMSISILCMPALVKRKEVAFKGTLMIAAVAALALFINNLSLTTAQSVIMIIIFAVFMLENILQGKSSLSESKDDEKPEVNGKSIFVNIVKFVFGALGIVVGADLLVDDGTIIARGLGVSEVLSALRLLLSEHHFPSLLQRLRLLQRSSPNFQSVTLSVLI